MFVHSCVKRVIFTSLDMLSLIWFEHEFAKWYIEWQIMHCETFLGLPNRLDFSPPLI